MDEIMKGILENHLARMNQINTESRQKVNDICGDFISTVRKYSGIKSKLLDASLGALGIKDDNSTVVVGGVAVADSDPTQPEVPGGSGTEAVQG